MRGPYHRGTTVVNRAYEQLLYPWEQAMVKHMKQILVDLDPSTAAELEEVAPARSRKRSEFIRTAIRRALDAVAQQKIDEGYRRIPDDRPDYFDPTAWSPEPHPDTPGKTRRRAAKRKGRH
jgi:hypothetical protein